MWENKQPSQSRQETIAMMMFTRFGLPLMAIMLIITSPGNVRADSDGLDTTRIRQTSKIKMGFGEALTEVPGEILKLPIRTIELFSKTVFTNPPVTKLDEIFRWWTKTRIVIPIAGYGSDEGLWFGFGITKLTGLGPNDEVTIKGAYSTNNYQLYDLKFRVLKLLGPHSGLDIHLFYQVQTREKFYGTGMDNDPDERANISFEKTVADVAIPIEISEKLTASISGGYQVTNIFDGEDDGRVRSLDSIAADPNFDIEEGQLSSSRFAKAGASFTIDLRRSTGKPSPGLWFGTDYTYFSGTDRSDGLNFSQYSFDLRYFQPVWRRRTLAFRALVKRFDGNDSNARAAPVDVLNSLGGIKTLRGYDAGRFLDNDLALASVEYRYPVHRLLDGFVFYEEGRVFESITREKAFKDWEYSSGFGFRYGTAEDVAFMAQVAFSDEVTRLYLEFGAKW